ncbi:aminoglycoside 6-adenylyltransferase [Paenibacillus sp. CAU 1782]
MRTEQEMMGLLIDFAQKDERIVAAVLEGSSSNVTIQRARS